jgi:hypothetical protein
VTTEENVTMNKAERFSEMARRWFEREDTGLTVDRFLRAIGKRATEEAAHIIQSEGPPRIGFMAWLVPFSDGSHAAMFMRDGAVPIIADIEPHHFEPALHYAAKLMAQAREAFDERQSATVH